MRITFLTCFLLLSVATLSRDGVHAPISSHSVRLKVKVVGQKYCALGSSGFAELRFTLLLRFQNLTKATLIFNRIALADSAYIGKTANGIRRHKYEPGSRVAETLGLVPLNWKTVGKTVVSGDALELTNTEVWIRLARDPAERELGASAGKHFLQVLAAIEVNEPHRPVEISVSSEPSPFLVERNFKGEACN